MGTRLKEEIKQSKPFTSLQQEALLNIQRTSGHVLHLVQQTLKPFGLTPPQYNVLRILRGAGEDGLRCSEIGERMLTRDPDITRLLERLVRRGLVERRRDAKDRRVIHSRISAEGLRIVRELDPAIEGTSNLLLDHMNPEKLSQLVELLEEVRHGDAA